MVFIFPFLVAAVIHACGWVLVAVGAMGTHDPFSRFTFTHVRSAGVGHWAELGAVFVPLLLWIPKLRVQPQAVLVCTAIAIAPWVGSLLGY